MLAFLYFIGDFWPLWFFGVILSQVIFYYSYEPQNKTDKETRGFCIGCNLFLISTLLLLVAAVVNLLHH
jgi:hypothetical protein